MEGNVLKKILEPSEGGEHSVKFIDTLLSNCELALQSVFDRDSEMMIESKHRFNAMFVDVQNLQVLSVEHQQHFVVFTREANQFVKSLLLYQSGLKLT